MSLASLPSPLPVTHARTMSCHPDHYPLPSPHPSRSIYVPISATASAHCMRMWGLMCVKGGGRAAPRPSPWGGTCGAALSRPAGGRRFMVPVGPPGVGAGVRCACIFMLNGPGGRGRGAPPLGPPKKPPMLFWGPMLYGWMTERVPYGTCAGIPCPPPIGPIGPICGMPMPMPMPSPPPCCCCCCPVPVVWLGWMSCWPAVVAGTCVKLRLVVMCSGGTVGCGMNETRWSGR
mmetsp:Transcript_47925/g.119905  ORF Transcript_47925/g.119905 Transcript_47925/m.119905 type:complete len:232 (-) Transcript_47925:1609-2304(-)